MRLYIKRAALVGLFFILSFFIANFVSSLNLRYKNKIQNLVMPAGDVLIVGGAGREKEVDWMQKTQLELEAAHKPLDQAKKLIKQENYAEALKKLREAQELHKKQGLRQWVLQTYFLDVYEALGDRENSLKTLDWLVAECSNDDYLKKLKARREKIIRATGRKLNDADAA